MKTKLNKVAVALASAALLGAVSPAAQAFEMDYSAMDEPMAVATWGDEELGVTLEQSLAGLNDEESSAVRLTCIGSVCGPATAPASAETGIAGRSGFSLAGEEGLSGLSDELPQE